MKSKRTIWVVECWAPKEPTWTLYFHTKQYHTARKEMAGAKRACPDCKFRLKAYTPQSNENKEHVIGLLKRAANFLDEYCSDASLGLRDQIDAYVKENR